MTKTASEYEKNVRDNLRTIMKQKNITQRQLADMTGYTESSITFWLKSRHLPSLYKLCDIADALGVSVYDILTGPGDEPVNLPLKTEFSELMSALFRLIPVLTDEQRDELLDMLERMKEVRFNGA